MHDMSWSVSCSNSQTKSNINSGIFFCDLYIQPRVGRVKMGEKNRESFDWATSGHGIQHFHLHFMGWSDLHHMAPLNYKGKRRLGKWEGFVLRRKKVMGLINNQLSMPSQSQGQVFPQVVRIHVNNANQLIANSKISYIHCGLYDGIFFHCLLP